MRIIVRLFLVGVIVLATLVLTSAGALAQKQKCKDTRFGCIEAPIPGSSIQGGISDFVESGSPLLKYTSTIFNIGAALVVVAGLIGIVIGGYIYMTASGSADRVSTAKGVIGAALLGIFLALASVVILNVINPQLGDQAVEPTFGDPDQNNQGN